MSHPGSADAVPTRARLTLSAWLAAAAAGAYLCRNCIVVAEKTIRSDIGLSEEQMGFVMGLFFWSYALAQIPGGWLGDRFGSRRCLPLFSALWSLAMLVWGVATGMAALVAARIGTGVSQAGLFPCAANSISKWYPLTERAFSSGMLAAAMQAGAVIAAPLTGLLLERFNWRIVFSAYALPGLLWAAGFWIWFRERPQEHPSVNEAELALIRKGRTDSADASTGDGGLIMWGRMATSPALWLICGQQFFRAAASVWFASWFATYLQETREVTRAASGWLTAIPLLASMAAALCSGGLSDWVLRRTGSRNLSRKGVATVSLLLCSVLVGGAYFIEDATRATAVIGAGAFFAACAGPCAYAVTIDMGGRHVAPVFSTMNMVGNFGAAVLSTLVPFYRNWIDGHDVLLALSGGNSWNAVLVLFGAMYVLAALCWLMLPLRRTIFE